MVSVPGRLSTPAMVLHPIGSVNSFVKIRILSSKKAYFPLERQLTEGVHPHASRDGALAAQTPDRARSAARDRDLGLGYYEHAVSLGWDYRNGFSFRDLPRASVPSGNMGVKYRTAVLGFTFGAFFDSIKNSETCCMTARISRFLVFEEPTLDAK